MKYSRKFLRSLRSSACTPCPQVLGELKSHGVLRYIGGKGGKKTEEIIEIYFVEQLNEIMLILVISMRPCHFVV